MSKQTAALHVTGGAMKNVEDNRRIYLLGSLRQPLERQLWRTPLSLGVRIFFREVLFYEFEERLFRIRLSLNFLLLSSHGGQDRKTSSRNTSRLLKGLSKTLDRRAKSFPRRTARYSALPSNVLPRVAFQSTEDDILRDRIAACKGLC
jgi:hypothetical protein